MPDKPARRRRSLRSFGPDLTALAVLHVVLVLLLVESVVVNYVGGVTSIVVNRVRAADPTFDPTFVYGLTTTAFATPMFLFGAFLVGRLTFHILHRKVWRYLLLVAALWIILRGLLAFSTAGQQEMSSADVVLNPVAVAATFVGHFVAAVLAMRLGHWSGRFAIIRRVARLHTAYEEEHA